MLLATDNFLCLPSMELIHDDKYEASLRGPPGASSKALSLVAMEWAEVLTAC